MADDEYYTLLGVERDATPAQVRKGYYKQARRWHPDKCTDDPTAEERFKQISEAYEVLSDSNKRAIYDREGKAGLSQQGGDMTSMLRALFGGGEFDSIFGDISTIGIVQDLMAHDEDSQGIEEQQQRKEARRRTDQEQCAQLAQTLLKKFQPHLEGNVAGFHQNCKTEAAALAEAPGGAELLTMVASVYNQKAEQFSGGFGYLSGVLKEKSSTVSSYMSIAKNLWNAHKATQQLARTKKEEEVHRRQERDFKRQLRSQQQVLAMNVEAPRRAQCGGCKKDFVFPPKTLAGSLFRCPCSAQIIAPLPHPPGDWACQRCTLQNPESTSVCQACAVRRPARDLPEDGPELEVGQTVVVIGLLKKPEYNDQRGVILAAELAMPGSHGVRQSDNGRISVKLAGGNVLAVKPENIRPLTFEEEAEEGPASADVEQLNKKVMSEQLNTMWNMGKLVLQSRVKQVVEVAFATQPGQSADAAAASKRKKAAALTIMGRTFAAAAKAAKRKAAAEGKKGFVDDLLDQAQAHEEGG